MKEVEKLAWLIAEEFVRAFEGLELLLDEATEKVVEAEQKQPPKVMTANASFGRTGR